jgi:hypothetical protein
MFRLLMVALGCAFLATALCAQVSCQKICAVACVGQTMQIGVEQPPAGAPDNPTSVSLEGPACPLAPPECEIVLLDGSDPICGKFTVIPRAAGHCQVTLTFARRPTFIADTTFGAYTAGGDCCQGGFPATSNALFLIPPPATDGGVD